jgi:hypothetical protein
MFQAKRAREDSRASPAAVFTFTTNSFSPRCVITESIEDVARKIAWGDLPDSNRHNRLHGPMCCRYTKITMELAVQAGFEPATVALTARRSTD